MSSSSTRASVFWASLPNTTMPTPSRYTRAPDSMVDGTLGSWTVNWMVCSERNTPPHMLTKRSSAG